MNFYYVLVPLYSGFEILVCVGLVTEMKEEFYTKM